MVFSTRKEIHCADCGRPLNKLAKIVKLGGTYFCLDCRVPIYGVVGYEDPTRPDSFWDTTEVQVDNPNNFIDTE